MNPQDFLRTTIENTAKAVVSVMRKNLYSVKVTNLPKVTEINGSVKVSNLKEIEVAYSKIKEMFDDLKDSLPNSVTVENFPEFPKFPEFKIPEFPSKIKSEITNEITVKEFKQLVGLTANISKKLDLLPKEFPKFPKFPDFPKIPAPIVKVDEKEFPSEIEITNLETLISKNPKAYVPVRLTDGEDFYESMARAFGGSIIESFADSTGVIDKALIDKQRHLQVDVLTAPPIDIDTSTLATSAKQLPDNHNVTVSNLQTEIEIKETLPTDSTKLNAITKVHTNVSGDLVKLEKIVGATTYTKTTDVTDQVITDVVTYSAWS